MEFKVNDKVRLRTDITVQEIFDRKFDKVQLSRFKNRVFTVEYFDEFYDAIDFEEIKSSCYSSWAFELVERPMKYKVGDMFDGLNNRYYVVRKIDNKRYYLDVYTEYGDFMFHGTVSWTDEELSDSTEFQQVAEFKTKEVKEMTVEEICKELGYDVKVVK